VIDDALFRTTRRAPATLFSAAMTPPHPAGDAPQPAELVRAAQSGDRAAFGGLYERYSRMVHGVVLAHARDEDVQDLVHDVFITAMRTIHTLREPEAVGAWLATIARNRARMHHRSSRPTEELSDQLASGGAAPDGALGASEVMSAIRRLPERLREPLVLRLLQEMNGEEIAEQTGLSHGTVRVYLHHGFAQLRALLGESHG
jgi:RNA polymerase sigma-70 factor (ECF subfamily)